MYYGYFGLSEAPFSITPNPRFVFLSRQHQDALAHLLYGIGRGGGGGFVQVTGEVGTGKTTLCRCLLEQLPDEVQIALILNPRLTPAELIASICDELRISYPKRTTSIKVLVDALNRYLLKAHAEGLRIAVIIDEAQNLDRDALEQIRLLTNLETATEKLLQIILVGQPELRTLLAAPDLRQLAQRVTARYHMAPLVRAETADYVEHRLNVAGAQRSLFTRQALRTLHRRADGVPRLINVIADRALLGAYSSERGRVNSAIVHRAADEVLGTRRRRWVWGAAALISVLAAAAVAHNLWTDSARPGDTDELAVAMAGQETSETAWRELLAMWEHGQVAFDNSFGAALDCSVAKNAGLSCTRLSGDWDSVRWLDRPVVLHLNDGSDALLTGMGESTVRLRISGTDRTLPMTTVDTRWTGEFSVAWQLPFEEPVPLSPGDEGDAVSWFKTQIDAIDPGFDPGPDMGRFDDTLRDWTQSFQVSRGLDPDGVIGERTLLFATSLFRHPAGPRLERLEPAPTTATGA
jgi:general secretion pathway protein A